jgi:hypothetical protein
MSFLVFERIIDKGKAITMVNFFLTPLCVPSLKLGIKTFHSGLSVFERLP